MSDDYLLAYFVGQRAGRARGEADGYDQGFADGREDGYVEGWNAAVERANGVIAEARFEADEASQNLRKLMGLYDQQKAHIERLEAFVRMVQSAMGG